MRLPLLLAAALLAGCADPTPPNPIAPIAKVNFQPLTNRIEKVRDSGTKVDKSLETTRDRLDAAIVNAHQLKERNTSLDANLDAAKASLTEAMAERKRQADEIVGLNIDKNAAEEDADKKNLEANAAVARANLAEGKVYKYEVQEKEDEGNWGLNGIWRWTKHLGWRVVFLVLIIAAITMALRLGAPAVIPIFTGIWKGVLLAVRWVWRIVSSLWQRKPPPPT